VDDLNQRLLAWLKLQARTPTELLTAEQSVRALERRYALTLPDDFRAYLLHVAPKDQEEWDDENVLWWPAERIKNVPDEYACGLAKPFVSWENSTLFFMDYAIWCWAWAICCSDDEHRGKVLVVGMECDKVVANSFSEFVDMYLRDPDWVSVGRPPRT